MLLLGCKRETMLYSFSDSHDAKRATKYLIGLKEIKSFSGSFMHTGQSGKRISIVPLKRSQTV